jgi:hypothetical protein
VIRIVTTKGAALSWRWPRYQLPLSSAGAAAPPAQLALAKPGASVAADVDRDLHRDLHVVAAEDQDIAVTDDVAGIGLFDANAGPP